MESICQDIFSDSLNIYSFGIIDMESIIYDDAGVRNYEEVLRLLLLEVQKKGWNMTEFSKRMKRSPAWASQVFTGKKLPGGKRKKIDLTVSTLLEIADVLGIRPSKLLDDTSDYTVPTLSLNEYIREIIRDELRKANISNESRV